MKKHNKLTRTALLFALCIVLNFAESWIILLPAFPGVKAGLSNIPVMFALFCAGFPTALGLAVAKGIFTLAVRGVSAGILSLAGGTLSVIVMWVLRKIFERNMSMGTLSISGAVIHNLAQLLAISFLWKTLAVWSMSPILIISGIVFGALNALLLKFTLPHLSKIGELK